MTDIAKELLHSADADFDTRAWRILMRRAAGEIMALRAERDEARALVGNETTLFGIMADIRQASGLGAKPMLSEIAGEIGKIRAERDDALEQLGRARVCLNCGRYMPADHPREQPLPECIGPEGLAACTFDHMPVEAMKIWQGRYYEVRKERDEAMKALEPFAAEFDEWGKFTDDFYITDEPSQDCNKAQFTMADLKRAYDLVNGEAK